MLYKIRDAVKISNDVEPASFMYGVYITDRMAKYAGITTRVCGTKYSLSLKKELFRLSNDDRWVWPEELLMPYGKSKEEYVEWATKLTGHNFELMDKEEYMKMVSVDIKEFTDKFYEEYGLLYINRDKVAGYDEAVKTGDIFIQNHPEFVTEFANYRGDLITSDREVAAFMFALEDMGAL